jgi:hypothetical protein
MEVSIHAAKCDQGTAHILELVHPHLQKLSKSLCGEFGGPMEHLWVDLELSPGDADRRPPFPFRFQKRVAPSREFKALGAKEYFNVGHYGVRPDYFALAKVEPSDVVCYLMNLVFESTAILEGKKQLRGFDVVAFRSQFAASLQSAGCAANTASRVTRQGRAP